MPTKSTRLIFRPITVADAMVAGLEDLAEAAFAEVEHLQDIFPFKLSLASYQMAERLGEFFAIGAFLRGDLVGFAGYSLFTPDHHADVKWAFARVLYMSPERRGWDSLDLMEAGEQLAMAKGAVAVEQAVKEPNSTDIKRSANLAELLVRKGYAPYERRLIKVLVKQ